MEPGVELDEDAGKAQREHPGCHTWVVGLADPINKGECGSECRCKRKGSQPGVDPINEGGHSSERKCKCEGSRPDIDP